MNKITNRQKTEIEILASSLIDLIEVIAGNIGKKQQSIFIEHFILSLRELSSFMDKYFYNEFNSIERKNW